MYEVQLVVTCQVDSDDQLDMAHSEVAAQQAVDEALRHAMNRGFVHGYVDVASIGIADVSIKTKTRECSICENETDVPVGVMLLEGQDVNQPVDIVIVCPHCFRTEVNAPGWGWANDYNDRREYELVDGKWVYKKGEL